MELRVLVPELAFHYKPLKDTKNTSIAQYNDNTSFSNACILIVHTAQRPNLALYYTMAKDNYQSLLSEMKP